jgi:hypothetical protein
MVKVIGQYVPVLQYISTCSIFALNVQC